MTSYLTTLNSLLTSTTSRYNSIRRNILSSSSEDDTSVDHPDLTHVSRVLRAYYTEKNRPLPSWLPPDPRAPTPTSNTTQAATSRPIGSLRARGSDARAGSSASAASSTAQLGGVGGGLGDLWGENEGAPAAAGRRRRGDEGGGGARPLPSQRAGSYQTQLGQGLGRNMYGEGGGRETGSAPGSSGGGGSVQERLKARLGSRREGGSVTPPPLGGGRYGGDGGGDGGGGGGGNRFGGGGGSGVGGRDDGKRYQGGGGGGEGQGSYATQGLSGWQGQGRR